MTIKKFLQRFFLALTVGALVVPAFAMGQTGSEAIRSFDVKAVIHEDATVSFVERIKYDFGQEQKHGIFRFIPVSYKTELGNNQSLKISNISVTDEDGTNYDFTTSRSGKNLSIKIGSADEYVTGVKTYIISYTADRAIGYFKGFDELYWNATGNEWEIPINTASFTIQLPNPIKVEDLRASCYFGSFGSQTQCTTVKPQDGTTVASITHSISNLAPREGLTVAVGFPKGTVREPTAGERFVDLAKDNGIIVLPVIVFLVMFTLWYKKGKDPQGRGTIVPEYDAPDNLTPLEMSAILHQSPRHTDISAEIIALAIKGYIKITKIETKGLLLTSTDYVLTRLKVSDGKLSAADEYLLNSLFVHQSDTSTTIAGFVKSMTEAVSTSISHDQHESTEGVRISSLKNHFYKSIPPLSELVMKSVIEKGYYPTDPKKVIAKYYSLMILCLAGFWVLSLRGLLSVLSVGSLIASGIIIGIFAYLMPKVTQFGAITRERIKGLKMYISVAEKDRINFHNAPAKNPELFEKLLPFAMVLGAEEQWAKQFEGIYTTPPSWYNDPSGRMFNAVILSHSLSSFSTAATSSLSTAPGGHSGSGGGGFSGGGGGGGGGGSW